MNVTDKSQPKQEGTTMTKTNVIEFTEQLMMRRKPLAFLDCNDFEGVELEPAMLSKAELFEVAQKAKDEVEEMGCDGSAVPLAKKLTKASLVDYINTCRKLARAAAKYPVDAPLPPAGSIADALNAEPVPTEHLSAKNSKIVVVKKAAETAPASELPPPVEPKASGTAEKKERTINLPDVFNGVTIPDYRKAPIGDLQDAIEALSGKRPRSQDRNYYREQLMLITRDMKNSFFLCPNELLERANAAAKAEGCSRSDLVVKALEAYLS
jgi:hypothetical protein